MDRKRYIELVNSEPFVSISGHTTGKKMAIREFTYGALVPDRNHPLSLVSVANSSISIDLWKGCRWQCRYCHVQGTNQDLDSSGKMPRDVIRRGPFTVKEVVDALIEHPFFIPDKTIISIGTASTEPFASAEVTESTFQIMRYFLENGWKNPFWIVTKASIPSGYKQDLAAISQSNGLMISICWADNPRSIEPVANNRFLNVEVAKEAGVVISWYMRPLVEEWGASLSKIEMMMLWVSKHYGEYIDMIVPGGLRWTEGIENGLTEIHGLPMPNVPRNDNVKTLSSQMIKGIKVLAHELFPGIPIFLKSSCALSYMRKVPSIAFVQKLSSIECETSVCSSDQRSRCARVCVGSFSNEAAQRVADNLGIPVRVKGWDDQNGLISKPDLSQFSYAIRQSLLKGLAEEGSLLWT